MVIAYFCGHFRVGPGIRRYSGFIITQKARLALSGFGTKAVKGGKLVHCNRRNNGWRPNRFKKIYRRGIMCTCKDRPDKLCGECIRNAQIRRKEKYESKETNMGTTAKRDLRPAE